MGIFLVGSLIQTIILINNEDYGFPNYQGTLLAIAAMVIAYIGAVFGAKYLHRWQTIVFAIVCIAVRDCLRHMLTCFPFNLSTFWPISDILCQFG